MALWTGGFPEVLPECLILGDGFVYGCVDILHELLVTGQIFHLLALPIIPGTDLLAKVTSGKMIADLTAQVIGD